MTRLPLRPLARILKAREQGENPDVIERENRAIRSEPVRERAWLRAEARLVLLAIVFLGAFATVGLRMGAMASARPEEPRSQVSTNQILTQRADITDRRGRVLATNLATHSLYVQPRLMVDPKRVAQELMAIFPDLDAERLTRQFTDGRSFMWVKKTISPEEMQAVHDIGDPGLLFGPREMRIYPNGTLAAHILGGARFEKEDVSSAEVVGVAGVEKSFDVWLRDPANNGAPLALSIDLPVQHAMEDVLSGGIKLMGAKGAAGVLMEVKTGEILAMASLPDFDPNRRPSPLLKGDPSDSPLFNRAVQGLYELGSTFKIFPVAQALELKLVNPRTQVSTRGPLRIGRFSIRDFHNYGASLSVTDVIVKSSNIGTVSVARMIGAERQRAFLGRLGLMEATPVELIEAPTARPLVPRRWPEVTSATVAFGHGLSASPLHLAAAYATLANRGQRVTPTIVHRDSHPQGEQVVSPAVAATTVELLRQVVVRGTARGAEIEGYKVAGKTGTADKPRPQGGYYDNKVIATFASVFPADDPKYVLVVSLDEPTGTLGGGESRVAGATAVPVAAQVIRRVAPLLGLRPEVEQGKGGKVKVAGN
ncbi:peptidoglycan D,D-transpeptidase FtsI family protein [Paracoccus sp. p4-l81]|uniref:peptidoglycan D,D-transpeptidase FtsI family protein n=1 Tax=unclassified Paracoccus (in: a-proteobacteria) TaxID=2688777 RepID=UPI0035BA595D